MRKQLRHLLEISAFLITFIAFYFYSERPIMKIIGIILFCGAAAVTYRVFIPWKILMKSLRTVFRKQTLSAVILYSDIVC
jgi:hypothetical protein